LFAVILLYNRGFAEFAVRREFFLRLKPCEFDSHGAQRLDNI